MQQYSVGIHKIYLKIEGGGVGGGDSELDIRIDTSKNIYRNKLVDKN